MVASIVLPSTTTLASAVTDASPVMKSTPFFFSRPATPPVSVEMTFSRRSDTAAKSISGAPTLMPNSPASWISLTMSAVRRTALAGMHATFRQRPPTSPFSITAVFRPSCAARIAAT